MLGDVASPYLDMWKDWQPAVRLWKPDAVTLKDVPAAGLVGITFRVAGSEQGAAIGTLSGIATAEALGEDGLGGFYVGSVDLATLTSQLPDGALYPHDAVVYLQVVKPGDIVVEPFQKRIRRLKY